MGQALAEEQGSHQKVNYFGNSQIELRDGDIILTNSPSAINSLLSVFGFPYGRYTHAFIYIESPSFDGKFIGFNRSGISITDPNERRYGVEYAHLRPTYQPAQGSLVNAFLSLKQRPLKFDFELRWPSLNSDMTYCAGFISQMYRLASMPDPFPPASQAYESFWGQWFQEHLEIDLSHAVSPNAILYVKDFELLSEQRSDNAITVKNMIIYSSIVERFKTYIEKDNMEFLPPKLGSKLLLQATSMGMLDGFLLSELPEKFRETFMPIYDYMERVRTRVNRTIYLNEDKNWDEQSIRELTYAAADAYRDNFFIAIPKEK